MNEATLFPSPNWYLSNIMACSRRGTLAWGAKNNIVIAEQKEDDRALKCSIITCAQKDRVTALAFCPKSEPDSPELIISCGDDDRVNIWNLDTLQIIMTFSFNDNKPIVGVDWSVKDHKLACAVNSEGVLLSCNTQYESSKKIVLSKLPAVCLACCPHDSSLVAVGSKNGLIHIIDLDKNGLILYRLRGHNEQIVSLSWCPSDINVLSEDGKRDLLLASGARDRSVFIWKAGGDGRYETVLNIPKLPIDSQSHKSKLGIGNWIVVNWVEPKVLLTSSIWGELLSWDFSANKKPACKLFHTYHNRGLFSIAIVPKYNATSNNWRTDSEFTVWTSAQDRWLICCRKQNDDFVELKRKIPTQGGYIYCTAACSIDTSCIAFGTGDAMLRLWKLSEPHEITFDVTMFWQKIKGKLRAIAWYPESERLIAFGTSEGRVGVFDVIKNDPVLFRQYHRNTVYKLEWGPVPENDLNLFSCAEGELVTYDMKNPDKKPMSIIEEGCTEFSWKPDKLILAIAMENGSIMFYDKKLKKCGSTVYILKKVINCLVWHPESTAADTWSSPMKDYLAVASDSPSITILDISDLRKTLETQEEVIDSVKMNEEGDQQRNVHKTVAKLNGHSEKVVCLAWSPHFSGYLVSGSYDYTAQVWNVETKELMGTFRGHNGPVLCCMWSPLKPQLIITGASDFMLCIWNYTKQSSSKQVCHVTRKNSCSKYDRAQKHKSWRNKTTTIESEAHDNLNMSSNDSTSPVNKQSSVCTTEAICTTEPKPQVPLVNNGSKKKERKVYLPIYTKQLSERPYIINCIRSDMRKSQKKQSPELQNGEKQDKEQQQQSSLQKEEEKDDELSLFSEQDLLEIFSHEREAHIAKNKHNIVTEMDLWRDNLKQNLECAAREKRLTDFLVSLSTSLSMKTWKEMCEAYAHQLIMEDHVEKAVSYLLCANKIYEAIKAFLDAKMYKEAYILARLRLAADDPVLTIVLQSWALFATNSGLLEQAAHCYVKLGEFTKAASILSRRSDPYCLEVASELAFITGDEEFGISLVKEATTHTLMKLEYSKAHSIIANIRQAQYLKVHIDAHEAITIMCKKDTLCDLMRTWLEGKSNYGLLQILKEKHGASYYDALRCNFTSDTVLENQAMMQLYASYVIAMTATCDIKETQLKYVTTALNNIFEYETRDESKETEFFIRILATLDARKPTDEGSIYAKSDYPVSMSIRAYLCSGLLNWLMIDSEQLSIEEETRCTELIETLLDDAFQQTVRDNICRTDEIKQLQSQLATLMVNKKDSEDKNEKEDQINLTEKLNNLKLDKRNFVEERICAVDPNLIYNQAQELSKILRDEMNRSRFLEILDRKYKTNLDSKI